MMQKGGGGNEMNSDMTNHTMRNFTCEISCEEVIEKDKCFEGGHFGKCRR